MSTQEEISSFLQEVPPQLPEYNPERVLGLFKTQTHAGRMSKPSLVTFCKLSTNKELKVVFRCIIWTQLAPDILCWCQWPFISLQVSRCFLRQQNHWEGRCWRDCWLMSWQKNGNCCKLQFCLKVHGCHWLLFIMEPFESLLSFWGAENS